MSAIKALEQWCKSQCEGYPDLSITNMTTSFKNGLAFCAIIHKFRPDLIDYDTLNKEDVFKNNSLAFRVAEECLGIPALLDAEDMVALRVPDRLSILTYVSQYHNYFRGQSPNGGVGGMKRPAEGSREEPSEKKNLPVVAKTFVSKTAVENRPPPSLAAETSPKLPRAADQKTVLTESVNKTGALNSRCAACHTHVHLVQRHFAEGKLYHRSCFKCSESSSVLLAGACRAGKQPSSLVCSVHQSSEPPTSSAWIRTQPPSAAVRPDADGSIARPATPHPSSVRPAPVTALTSPEPQPWTSHVRPAPVTALTKLWESDPAPRPRSSSAQKTQEARLRFFQAEPVAPEVSPRRSEPPLDVGRKEAAPHGPKDEKSGARFAIVKKLAVENQTNNNNNARPSVITNHNNNNNAHPSVITNHNNNNNARPSVITNHSNNNNARPSVITNHNNNNNAHPSVITSPERRFGEGPGLAVTPGWRQTDRSEGTAGRTAAQLTSSSTCSPASPWQQAVSKEASRTTALSAVTTDLACTETPVDLRSKLRSVKNGAGPQISGSVDAQSVSDKNPTSGIMSVSSPSHTITTTNPPSHTTTTTNTPSHTITATNPPSHTTTTTNPPSHTITTTNPPSHTITTRNPPSHTITTTNPPSPRPPVVPAPCSPSGPASPAAPPPRPRGSGGKGSQNGTFFSPTNASKWEMRSPSSKPRHVPMEEVPVDEVPMDEVPVDEVPMDEVPMDEVVKELNDIEDRLTDLERDGVELEKRLRSCEEGEEDEEDVLTDPLMVDWFSLIRKKQMFIRRESELVYIVRFQALEEQQRGVEGQLRDLLEKPEHLRSVEECTREVRLMDRLCGIVNGRNAIVEGLDEDRLREEEEDQQLNEMIQNLGVRKSKNKRKSSIKKLFRRSKKLEVE